MAKRPYNILVLGDSVAWGQGLQHEEKYTTRAQRWIEQYHAQDFDVQVTTLAHSGAIIGIRNGVVQPALDPEIPDSYPTIKQQVEAAAIPASGIDLVFLNGGINDVGAADILSPFTDNEELKDRIRQHCGDDLSTLLVQAGRKFHQSQTRMVVHGYYPILSHDSNHLHITTLLASFGVTPALPFLSLNPFKEIIDQALLFWHESERQMRRAVDEANAALGGPARIFFVRPSFTEFNAALASDAYVFGLTLLGEPEDSVAPHRAQVCFLPGQGLNFLQMETCYRASAGHPNVRGAERFFNDTWPLLQTFGL